MMNSVYEFEVILIMPRTIVENTAPPSRHPVRLLYIYIYTLGRRPYTLNLKP